MQLEHSFTVPATIDEAWQVLIDIERVAPCMPGAALETVHGDDFTGTVKVKLGPIGLTYKGKASFVEKDEATHRAVIDAHGRDSRGNGTAAAKVTATLTEEGTSTKVEVTTDLDITGKPAQFGRGVMVDVGNKLIGQFAACLAGKLGGAPDEPTAPSSPAPAAASGQAVVDSGPVPAAVAPTTDESANGSTPAAVAPTSDESANGSAAPPATPAPGTATPSAGPRLVAPQDVQPIDLLGHAGPAVAKRLAPVLGGIIVVLLVLRLLRRRS